MKIIWVTNTFRYSAIELTVKSFIQDKNVKDNLDLIILQIDDEKNKSEIKYINQLKKLGVKFIKIKYETYFGIAKPKVLFETFRIISSNKPELVHIYCERFSFYLAMCSRLLKIPTVKTVCHIFDFGKGIIPVIRRFSKIIQRFILRKLKVTFLTCSDTNSEHERNYFYNNNAAPIYNWFDPNDYSLKKKENFANKLNLKKIQPITFCTIGGNWYYKNFQSVIRAIQLTKENNPEIYKKIEYIQIGSNNQSLVSLAKKLKVKEKCKFLGRVKDWREYLCKTDFLIAPSFEEGLNLSVVESSAFGIIPILSKRKCLNEHQRLGRDVIWLEDIDSYSIYKKIISLDKINNMNLIKAQKRIARNSFKYYSSTKIIPKLLEVYLSRIKN